LDPATDWVGTPVSDLVDWKSQTKKWSVASYDSVIRKRMLELAVADHLMNVVGDKLYWDPVALSPVQIAYTKASVTAETGGIAKYTIKPASSL
jgi:hypothetical protein